MNEGFLQKLRRLNIERQKEWDPNNKATLSFRGLEFAGEAGELASKIKKLARKTEFDLVGSDYDMADIEEEVGDVLITLDLVCQMMGIDIEKVTIDKFDKTSDKVGMSTKFNSNSKQDENYGNITVDKDKRVNTLNKHLNHVYSLSPYEAVYDDLHVIVKYAPFDADIEYVAKAFECLYDRDIMTVRKVAFDDRLMYVPLHYRIYGPDRKLEPYNNPNHENLYKVFWFANGKQHSHLIYSDNGRNAVYYLADFGMFNDIWCIDTISYCVTKEHIEELKLK